jgi:hypothetical protein
VQVLFALPRRLRLSGRRRRWSRAAGCVRQCRHFVCRPPCFGPRSSPNPPDRGVPRPGSSRPPSEVTALPTVQLLIFQTTLSTHTSQGRYHSSAHTTTVTTHHDVSLHLLPARGKQAHLLRGGTEDDGSATLEADLSGHFSFVLKSYHHLFISWNIATQPQNSKCQNS